MDYYELSPGIYRIQAGVGSDGEIYGGIFLKDEPNILIGASGGTSFVRALLSIMDDIGTTQKLRIYYPSVTYEEVMTAYLISKKLPEATFYVHVDIIEEFRNPREDFLDQRYFVSPDDVKYFKRNLPNQIDNVLGYNKAASFETQHTKILIIPFAGPHRGHSFIYSRDHKLLCSGLLLGRTSNPYTYYMDLSGSYQQYLNGLSFLEKARSEIIFPSYDEPEFTTNLKFKAESVRSALKDDMANILEILSLSWKSLDQITDKYIDFYSERYSTSPYDRVNIHKTKIYHLLNQLVVDKKVVKQEDQYRINK